MATSNPPHNHPENHPSRTPDDDAGELIMWQPDRGLSHSFLHHPRSMSGKSTKPWRGDPDFTGRRLASDNDHREDRGGPL